MRPRAFARQSWGCIAETQRNAYRPVVRWACCCRFWIFAELAEEVHELEQFVFDDPILLRAHAHAGSGLDGFFVAISRIGYQGVIAIDRR